MVTPPLASAPTAALLPGGHSICSSDGLRSVYIWEKVPISPKAACRHRLPRHSPDPRFADQATLGNALWSCEGTKIYTEEQREVLGLLQP